MEPNENPTPPSKPVENGSDDSSLTLSLTPPLLDETSTISEHISLENDRSMQEIEVSLPDNFPHFPQHAPEATKTPSLTSRSSIISLNGLDQFISNNIEDQNNVANILDEILANERFKSGENSHETSFDIFGNVDLSDHGLNSYKSQKKSDFGEAEKRVRDFEELIALKDTAIEQLTAELDSYRELMSFPSSNSLGTSTTEYKQVQEEHQNKVIEFYSALAHKDEQIEKLSQSVQQAALKREEMKQHFKNELGQLQEELRKTSDLLKIQRKSEEIAPLSSPRSTAAFYNEIMEALGPEKANLAENYRKAVEREQADEIRELKARIEADRAEYDQEMSRLKSLLSKDFSSEVDEVREGLKKEHSKEVEELRRYFEQKCAELEKNYSEEMFSRKASGSSSCSEAELSNDFGFNAPGPAGDSRPDYTKKDLIRFKNDLVEFLAIFDKYKSLNELSSGEFDGLRDDLGKFDRKSMLKFDLGLIRSELRNKYNAELEILRQDFDNQVDLVRLEHEKEMEGLRRRYTDEIEELNRKLNGRIVTSGCFQEVANSGEFEIDEVVQSYERRLQEQVTFAKIDIINALEAQIQRLVSCENLDEDWPEELVQLKSRFAEQHEAKLAALRHQHEIEITDLKKSLNSARRRSIEHATTKIDNELQHERDSYKKQTIALRNLLAELLKYFTQCEDELNNTLVEELISNKRLLDDENTDDSISMTKRVHLTPNFSELIDLIDNDRELDLKGELSVCLEKLKLEANAILALTSDPQRPDNELKLIAELKEAKLANERMENEQDCLLERERNLEVDLRRAREKIGELMENGRKEIVSEGYGDDGVQLAYGLAAAVTNLVELQAQARVFLEKQTNLDANCANLIDDLAKAGERIADEARKDHDDLKQQIEAADKKYKITCQFLEEQAAEREQERDEAQREIDRIKDLLRDRDKDRASFERYSAEVEHLEGQLREMTKACQLDAKRCKEVESERQEAIEKIYELRDIIRDLEEQIKNRTRTEDELKAIIEELEVYVRQQVDKSEEKGRTPEIDDLHTYIANLEGEVQQLRLAAEIAGSEGALQQIKNHLAEFEGTLDRRTKDLEALHAISTTTCSSPSEDMSIRDVLPPPSILDECEIPLQQLARLKEKLVRHSRAEDAALKRIRDLEMELTTQRTDFDECLADRDILKKQTSDHLILISNLQIRLDEQRLRAEHIEKQTNTSLEVQNYELKNSLASLEERLSKKDKLINQLKADLIDTKQHLIEKDEELAREPEIIAEMQQQLEFYRNENARLNELSEIEQMRRESTQNSFIRQPEAVLKRDFSDTRLEPEISSIEKVSSHEKHVRFEDDARIDDLKEELRLKSQLIDDYEAKLKLFEELEDKIDQLQANLVETELELNKATETFTQEQDKYKESEALLKSELAQTKTDLAKAQTIVDEVKQLKMKLETSENGCVSLKKALVEANETLDLKRIEYTHRIAELSKELGHLQQLINEKDKIITQMSEDSRSLHANLETIQSKMQETGNIVDLGRRLRDEQKKNADLTAQMHVLKAQMLGLERESIDEVAGQIQRELDYSAQLDSSLFNVLDSSLDGHDLEAVRLALKKQKSVNRHLSRAKECVEKKCEELEAKLVNRGADDGKLVVEMEDGRRERKRLEFELKAAKMSAVEVGALRKQVKCAEDEAERVKNELDAVVGRNFELQTEIERLRSGLGIKNGEIKQLETRIRLVEQHEELVVKQLGNVKLELVEKIEQNDFLVKKMREVDSKARIVPACDCKKGEDLPLPAKLMEKIRELRGAVNDNMQMVDVVMRLNNEKRALEERIEALETNQTQNLPFDDPTSRANYLFAKYLRSESYRKALIWQKRFMISLLETYQMDANAKASSLPNEQPKRSAGIRRFKRVALMIVSVQRIKYLVRRWHSGKRIVQHQRAGGAQFQVGQPVSSQVFVGSTLNLPWSGMSPPSRDTQRNRQVPLASPGLLNRYVERFNQIQDRLGLDDPSAQ